VILSPSKFTISKYDHKPLMSLFGYKVWFFLIPTLAYEDYRGLALGFKKEVAIGQPEINMDLDSNPAAF